MSWESFVSDYHIESKRGSGGTNLEIRCPLCSNDHGKHMGVSLESSSWGCWRNEDHRGKNPARLIRAILRCSPEEAQAISANYFGNLGNLFSERKERKVQAEFKMPPQFFQFGYDEVEERRFKAYLESRRLDSEYCIRRFDLRWTAGRLGSRIVVPQKEDGRWVSWVARSIDPTDRNRYIACSEGEGGEEPIKFMFDQDNCRGGDTLVVGEGVFDAIPIISAMIAEVSATATYGKVLTAWQLALLAGISKNYRRVLLGWDEDAFAGIFKVMFKNDLFLPNFRPTFLGKQDWGSMTRPQIKGVLK